MQKILWLAIATCILCSCGGKTGQFRLEGRLRNLHVGEFWMYSPDGAFSGFDTIMVRDGRFAYEMPLDKPATLVIIFPNYSEQPIFAEPGEIVKIKGDATHLKEMTISGTDDNKRMTQLRMDLNKLTPPEIPDAVEQFIRENSESPVSLYLLRRYFIQAKDADLKKALALTNLLLKEQEDILEEEGEATPQLGQLTRLQKELKKVQGARKDETLPAFYAKDVKGQQVTEKQLSGKVNVVTAWASWSGMSSDMQRRLSVLKKKYANQLGVISICLDANAKACKRSVERDSLKWSTICDGTLWNTPLLTKLGIGRIPGNILMDQQRRIIARDLTPELLEKEIKKRLD